MNTLTQGLAQGDAKRGDRRQRRQRQGCGHRDADGRRQRPKRAAEGPQLKVHQGAESRQANQRRYRCRCREAQRSRRRHGTSLGVQSIPPLLLPYPSRNNRIPKYHPNSTTTSLTNHPRELQVSAARVENMQLKALHEQLTAELCAATKATAAAETAAEKRAVAGAEAAKMASQDNARLRDVNVELVKALKLAQKESRDSQKPLAVAETKASKALESSVSLQDLNSKLVGELRVARRSAKEAKAASEESAKAAASAHEMFKTVVEVRLLRLFAHPRGTLITHYNCLIQPKQNNSPRSTPRTHRALTGTNQAPGAQRPSPIRAQVEQKIRGRHETKTQSHRRNGRRDAKPEQAVHRRTAQGSGRSQDEREIRRRVRDATRGESLFVFSYKAIRN